MFASIIVITKNQKRYLQKSLPILLKQNIKEKYEIIIVDSGSTDGAREYVKSLPVKLTKINPDSFKFAKAFNIGAGLAKGIFLVRLSGDVVPKRKDFLNEILKPFSDKKVGDVYGKYTLTGKNGYTYPNFWPSSRFPNKSLRFSLNPNLFKMIFDKIYLEDLTSFAGACCAVRTNIWKKRHFNENLLGGEDGEYSIYLHKIGFDIMYNPSAEVFHEHKIENLNAGFWNEIRWKVIFGIETIKLLI